MRERERERERERGGERWGDETNMYTYFKLLNQYLSILCSGVGYSKCSNVSFELFTSIMFTIMTLFSVLIHLPKIIRWKHSSFKNNILKVKVNTKNEIVSYIVYVKNFSPFFPCNFKR